MKLPLITSHEKERRWCKTIIEIHVQIQRHWWWELSHDPFSLWMHIKDWLEEVYSKDGWDRHAGKLKTTIALVLVLQKSWQKPLILCRFHTRFLHGKCLLLLLYCSLFLFNPSEENQAVVASQNLYTVTSSGNTTCNTTCKFRQREEEDSPIVCREIRGILFDSLHLDSLLDFEKRKAQEKHNSLFLKS